MTDARCCPATAMVCESCIREAAAKLGMIDPVWRDEAIVSMHELQRVADELLAERDEARMLVDLIRDRDEPVGLD